MTKPSPTSYRHLFCMGWRLIWIWYTRIRKLVKVDVYHFGMISGLATWPTAFMTCLITLTTYKNIPYLLWYKITDKLNWHKRLYRVLSRSHISGLQHLTCKEKDHVGHQCHAYSVWNHLTLVCLTPLSPIIFSLTNKSLIYLGWVRLVAPSGNHIFKSQSFLRATLLWCFEIKS